MPTTFYSVLVSISVFVALSTVFHSKNSPDNSPRSYSVLPVLFLPDWSFQRFISMKVSFSPDAILKAPTGYDLQVTFCANPLGVLGTISVRKFTCQQLVFSS